MRALETGAERRDVSVGAVSDVVNIDLSAGFAPVASVGLPIVVAPRVLVAAEAFSVLAAALLAKTIYLDWIMNTYPPNQVYLSIALCMCGSLYVVYNQMGLYEIENFKRPEVGFGSILGGLLISLLMVLGLLYSLKQLGDLSRGWVLMWLGLMAIPIVLFRFLFVQWFKRAMATGLLAQRIAIIGTGDFPVALANRIRATEGLSGAIDLYNLGSRVRNVGFVGGLSELEAAMATRPYDRVVVGIAGGDAEAIRTTVKSLGCYTTELLLCTDLNPLPVSTNGAQLLTGTRTDIIHLVPKAERWGLIKRTIDIMTSATALLVLSPLLLMIAVAIKLDTRGPVLFRQRRLGQNSTVFRIFKFRTMTVLEDGPVIMQATSNDHRVTHIGRLLRSTSLDELPQLLNVLLGDMSLVGPRPHAIAHDHEFEKQSDLFSRRRRVRPGITGWAQVNGYRGETRTIEDIHQRMKCDLYYVDNWSVWLDIEILVRTPFVLLRGAH